jgi:hypothetical protein
MPRFIDLTAVQWTTCCLSSKTDIKLSPKNASEFRSVFLCSRAEGETHFVTDVATWHVRLNPTRGPTCHTVAYLNRNSMKLKISATDLIQLWVTILKISELRYEGIIKIANNVYDWVVWRTTKGNSWRILPSGIFRTFSPVQINEPFGGTSIFRVEEQAKKEAVMLTAHVT